MGRVEDKLKNRYSNQEFTNDGFDSEDLWNNITNELDEPKIQPNAINKKNILLSILSIALLLLIVALALNPSESDTIVVSNQVNENKNNLKTENTNTNNPLVNKEDTKLNSQVSNTIISNIKSVKKEAILKNNLTNQINSNNYENNSSGHSFEKQYSTNNYTTNTKEKVDIQRKTANSNSKLLFDQSQDFTDSKLASSNNEINNSKIQKDEYPTTSNEEKSILLNPEILSKKYFYLKNPLTVSSPINFIENKKSRNIYFEVGILGGLNVNKIQYKSDDLLNLVNSKKASESIVVGQNYGVESSIIIKEQYTFSMGLEYSQLWSQFDYDNTTAFQETRTNQLLKVWVNNSTGDTIRSEYGDAIINGTVRRQITHYNSYKKFSIPFEIGIRKQINKLEYGLRTGASLNFTTAQAGRTFDKNLKIVDFNKEGSVAPFNSFAIGIRLNPYIGYRFSDNTTFRIHPQWSWMSGNNFDGTDIKLNINQFNLNFGVVYSIQ